MMFLVLYCIALLLSSLSVNSQNYLDQDENYDGTREATLIDAPYIVSLQITFKKIGHICGGTLISRAFVVSAAHCFRSVNPYAVKHLMVIVHDVDSTFDKGTKHRQVRKCQEFYIHENYTSTNFDIALVQVTKPFEFNRYTVPIQLASKSFPDQQNCVLFGWGRSPLAANTPTKILKMAEMKIDIDLTCATLNAQNEICAGNMETGHNACVGDSGGPLVCDGVLAGVVSRGAIPCTNRLLGSVFTNVTYFRGWIKNIQHKLELKSISKFKNVIPFALDHASTKPKVNPTYCLFSLHIFSAAYFK